jgi:hypothetical protein
VSRGEYDSQPAYLDDPLSVVPEVYSVSNSDEKFSSGETVLQGHYEISYLFISVFVVISVSTVSHNTLTEIYLQEI